MENTRQWFIKNRNYYYDNKEMICVNCKATDNLHLHHIVPLALGGTNKLTNVTVLCEECHGKVHGTSWERHSEATKKGLQKARLNGKELGRAKGTKVTTKKSVEVKAKIRKLSKDFEGSNTDKEVIDIVKVNRNTYYKYKKELVQELQQEQQ